MHSAATGGTLGSVGSGRLAFAHSARTLPTVSAPSSVVRSITETASLRAATLDSFLTLRLASAAARSWAPTWSTAKRDSTGPSSNWCRNPSPASASRTGVAMTSSSPAPGGCAYAALPIVATGPVPDAACTARKEDPRARQTCHHLVIPRADPWYAGIDCPTRIREEVAATRPLRNLFLLILVGAFLLGVWSAHHPPAARGQGQPPSAVRASPA